MSNLRERPLYYFSWSDQEILEDHLLSLSCDEDTWLYKVGSVSKSPFRFTELDLPTRDHQIPTGGMVDSRTFTRRKPCALRPSLESVNESFNRSSLGLLNSSKLNDCLHYMQTPSSESQEKISSSSTVSDCKPLTQRVFKLDSPFTNTSALGGNKFSASNYVNERPRLNSDGSDFSVPYSIKNCSFIEKNCHMTDSLLNFLYKSDNKHEGQSQVECIDTISLPDSCDSLSLGGSSVTDSVVEPVDCRPPRGFRDDEMIESVVNVHEVEGFPNSEMTTSIRDYLDTVKSSKNTSSETENIPPMNCVNSEKCQNPNETITLVDDRKESNKMNSTYNLEKSDLFEVDKPVDTTYDLNNEMDEINVPFTNTVNITRETSEKTRCNEELNRTRTLDITYEKQISSEKEKSISIRALNNRDLNSNEMIQTNRQIPSRNSTFNTTFTKLSLQGSLTSLESTRSKNNELFRSTEAVGNGLEDDSVSSASDSSLSSCSTKPRSVDELRTIAQLQESILAHCTSTPDDSTKSSSSKMLDREINLSPINSKVSRSASSSPNRGHPVSRLTRPTTKGMQCMVPASSLSNIARPQLSGLRMPKPVNKFTAPQTVDLRPSTVPLPRQQISRLPMPRLRGSGIPALKRRQL